MIVCASLMTYQKEASLELIALSFAIFKVLEYSIRSFTLEMVSGFGVFVKNFDLNRNFARDASSSDGDFLMFPLHIRFLCH